ncbi:MAG: hydroxylamine reductase, partial [Candidatus Methanomethylophilaceae archaeon]|nr:hydroxylamine reductase [Candidatus Methanomethylophilaceae archaeon]
YSLVVIANALADAFGTDVNGLPLSFNISWYEQKAVLVLLSLLKLGVKDIMLGPRLPGFITPNILNVLVDTFGIKANSTVEQDMVILNIE